jgi:hypothetical protein
MRIFSDSSASPLSRQPIRRTLSRFGFFLLAEQKKEIRPLVRKSALNQLTIATPFPIKSP